MKRFRTVFLSMMCIFCLTGCMRFNTTITVKNNGKLDVSMMYAMMDMNDYGYDADSLTDDQIQDFENKGWEVEEYNQDGFKGFIVSKKDVTAKELAASMENTQSEISGDTSSINFTRHGIKYVLDWKVFDNDEGEQLAAYKNFFTMSGGYMKMTVNLPVKPSASNATSVSNDGKTLEWDLLNLGPDQSIHLEFMLINIWLIIGLCAIAFVIVACIVLAIVLSSEKKKVVQIQQPANNNLVADELTKLKKLLDDGVITQEEFDFQKSRLLNQ